MRDVFIPGFGGTEISINLQDLSKLFDDWIDSLLVNIYCDRYTRTLKKILLLISG